MINCHHHFGNILRHSRYPSQSVPTTIVGLEKWLQELWREKEQMLEKFHCGTDCEPASKSFQATMPGSNDSRCRARPQQVLPLQMLSLVAWTYFIYYVVAHVLFRYVSMHHSVA